MVKIYIDNFLLKIKKELEYKESFIMSFISQFFILFSSYYMIIALFQKFNNIKGFSVYEVLLCYSIITFGFSFNEVFFKGLDKFEDFIIDGSFDRLLLRPRNILLQIISSDMDIIKIARLVQAIIIFIIAIANLNIIWNIKKILLIFCMFISSILIFFGLLLITASYCFFTINGLEIKNLLTDGGRYMAQYPIGILKKGFIFFFTYIIPFSLINYYPLLYLIGKKSNSIYMLSPIFVIIYLIPCFLSFKFGLKHYSSTGS